MHTKETTIVLLAGVHPKSKTTFQSLCWDHTTSQKPSSLVHPRASRARPLVDARATLQHTNKDVHLRGGLMNEARRRARSELCALFFAAR